MTDKEQSLWSALRVIAPICMFCIVAFGLSYFTKIPLVLSVVIACFAAIIEYVTLTWVMRRRGGQA